MKRLMLFAFLILCNFNIYAQDHPENNVKFGTYNLRNDSARLELTTNSVNTPVSFSTLTFDWTNGPPEEINYKNHTWGFGFNTNFNGTKINQDEVSYTYANESKYRNGIAGQPGTFVSEHHFNWCSPYNTICIRPFGLDVQYDTGNTYWTYHGQINFFRHKSNGSGQNSILYDDGFWDMSLAPNGSIRFKNNIKALSWRNAAGTNSVTPLYVDDQDRTILGVGGGGSDVYVQSNWMDINNIQLGSMLVHRAQPSTKMQMAGFYTWIYSDNSIVASFSKYQVNLHKAAYISYFADAPYYKSNGIKVVGSQCSSIPNSNGTQVDDTRAINATLACMRNHGLVAQ